MKFIVAGAALLLTAAAPAPTPSYDWKLTPTGWGPVRIGMNRDRQALHVLHEHTLDIRRRRRQATPGATAEIVDPGKCHAIAERCALDGIDRKGKHVQCDSP